MNRPAFYLFPTLALLVHPGAYSADGSAFRCSAARESPKEEQALLSRAPHGARRITKRLIEVGWAGGKRIFTDEPPYDESLAGVRWVYCGYDPKLKLHLLYKDDETVGTGVLLDDATGSLLPGGQEVLFSPDQRYYLAYEMEDGDTTEILTLYRRSGGTLWTGHNGFTKPETGEILAEFKDLHWTSQNTVQALAVPADGTKPVTVTLAPGLNGKWEWLPRLLK
jgi:hypothetical protein